MTVDIDSPPQQARQIGKMQIEIDMWISPDVPGSQELRAFYEKNGAKFPWSALSGGGGNPQLQQAMADVQRKMASMNGVPVEQIVKVKASGAAAAMGASSPAMAQARAKLEALKAQGGPMAPMAEKQLAMMGGNGSSGSLLEMTMDSGDFSSASLPDSAFALPEGYKKAN